MLKFSEPIYITKPILPSLESFSQELDSVWQSKRLSNHGPKHESLETQLKNYLKIPFLSLFNNGTIALMGAFRALGLKGEVITTPFTFPATISSLEWMGLQPVFADIDPLTFNLDPARIERAITPQTSAILAVHVFGKPCPVEELEFLAKKYKLKLIFDGAHAFGLEINSRGIGNWGDMTMYSFHPTKLFHTAEGGALGFRDPDLYSKLYLLKNFGINNEESVTLSGINGKMNEIQASLGLLVLKMMDQELMKRKTLEEIYSKELAAIPGLNLPVIDTNVRPSYQYYVIKINEKEFGLSRDQLHEELKKYNLFCRKYFYPLCSSYDHLKHLPSAQFRNLPHAHQVVSEVLTLPFYGEFGVEGVLRVVEIIKHIQKTNGQSKKLWITQ